MAGHALGVVGLVLVTACGGGDADDPVPDAAPTTTSDTAAAEVSTTVTAGEGPAAQRDVTTIQPPAPGRYRLEVVRAGDGDGGARREDQVLEVASVLGDDTARRVTSTIGDQVSVGLSRWTDALVTTDLVDVVAADPASRCDWKPDQIDVDLSDGRRSWSSTSSCAHEAEGATVTRTVEEEAAVVEERTTKVAGREVFVYVIERSTVVRIAGARTIQEMVEEVELFSPELGIAVRSGIDVTITSEGQPDAHRRVTLELVELPG
jgi:hypothetical protein